MQDNPLQMMASNQPEGILLIDKPQKITSFGVIAALRRLTKVQKIGHCGTLDPLATGLLVCLVGKKYTKLSDKFLGMQKAYIADLTLGSSTNTYDSEGQVENKSDVIPSLEDIKTAILGFQGTTMQIPPQFSAKKVGGVKACDAARSGRSVNLAAQEVTMHINLISYNYPTVVLEVSCSKGTYIRSLAHDLGLCLKTYAHLSGLRRTQSGSFLLSQAISLHQLIEKPELLSQYLNNTHYV